MPARNDLDEVAAHALRICEDLREADVGTDWHYGELAQQCATDPDRMAQVIMCLAVWVPFEQAPSTLADRAQSVADYRAEILHWRSA